MKVKRRIRKGEHTCYCSSYNFPHRFGGGKCDGKNFVIDHWETYFGHNENCQLCPNLDNNSCQVVIGIESTDKCYELQEYKQINEIK